MTTAKPRRGDLIEVHAPSTHERFIVRVGDVKAVENGYWRVVGHALTEAGIFVSHVSVGLRPEDFTYVHTCALPASHPEFRTVDYCRGCQDERVRGLPVDPSPSKQHAGQSHPDDICTHVGCEVCP